MMSKGDFESRQKMEKKDNERKTKYFNFDSSIFK